MTTLNITNPDEFVTRFNEALNAPSSRLRHIIRDVCRLLPAALPIVSDFLLVSEEQVPGPDDSGSDSEVNANVDTETDEPKAAALRSKKRARARIRARYAVCVNCEVEYDVTENSREEAVHGKEYWDGIDLWEDEEIDTEENREDHPEGFVYGCCGEYYGEEGCKVGWHEEEERARDRKRRRI
ncbi:uncharacterized protein NFIA_026350 [Aspergillus fischeri NRRL 181]|uniref:Uncharacterized protein n=1 Tax=Neosartorya fischeri (strain ATCC 1020 / DSM 3700 / CBS 544.65 / FGSC A1164 / JCM 1740 / NRRL 181 / WB 181) TaxID=331117 RepID=A1DCK1_NEOFI|nr:uncharacterized protein NFIA_026350 [Aspergillus fischeri NRRL 181]EAW19561.1 hypothetical protein NFIA_026350 [Aspergillus fischeri NRRL 181]